MIEKFFAWAGSFFGGSLSSVFTLIAGSIFQFYKQAQDTKVAEFTQGTNIDVEAYKAYLAYDQSLALARLSQSAWWGGHLCFMIVALPVCMHTGLIYVDTYVRLGCGHYGCLGISDVPATFQPVRGYVMAYLFGLAGLSTFKSIASPLLKK